MLNISETVHGRDIVIIDYNVIRRMMTFPVTLSNS